MASVVRFGRPIGRKTLAHHSFSLKLVDTGYCSAIDQQHCTIRFIDLGISTQRLPLPPHWKDRTPTVTSIAGKCELDSALEYVTISSSTWSTSLPEESVTCSFFFPQNTFIPTIFTATITWPKVFFYTLDIYDIFFFQNENTCRDQNLIQNCIGTFTPPIDSLPLRVNTTSTITLNTLATKSDLELELIERVDSVNTYEVSLPSNSQFNGTKPELSLILQKSTSGSLLIFYKEVRLSSTTTESVTLFDASYVIRYSLIKMYLHENDCYNTADSRCTIIYELPLSIPIDPETFNVVLEQFSDLGTPVTYFTPSFLINNKPSICTATHLPPSSEHIDDPTYVRYCSLYRKPFHNKKSTEPPASLSATFPFTPRLINIIPTLTIPDHLKASLYYHTPISIIWDEEDCTDQWSPTCTATVSSRHVGGALSVSIDRSQLPFSGYIDGYECDSPSMGIDTSLFSIEFPAPTGAKYYSTDKSRVEIDLVNPETGATLLYHSCKLKFALTYGKSFLYRKFGDSTSDLSTYDIPLTSDADKLIFTRYTESSVHRNPIVFTPDFLDTQYLPLYYQSTDGVTVSPLYATYRHLIFTLTSNEDCQNSSASYCSVSVYVPSYTTIVSTHPGNYLRDFSLTFNGMDPNQIATYGDYSWSATNLLTNDVLTVDAAHLETLSDSDAIFEHFGMEVFGVTNVSSAVYFRFSLAQRLALSPSLLYLDVSAPVIITLSYRKKYHTSVASLEFDNTVPSHPLLLSSGFDSLSVNLTTQIIKDIHNDAVNTLIFPTYIANSKPLNHFLYDETCYDTAASVCKITLIRQDITDTDIYFYCDLYYFNEVTTLPMNIIVVNGRSYFHLNLAQINTLIPGIASSPSIVFTIAKKYSTTNTINAGTVLMKKQRSAISDEEELIVLSENLHKFEISFTRPPQVHVQHDCRDLGYPHCTIIYEFHRDIPNGMSYSQPTNILISHSLPGTEYIHDVNFLGCNNTNAKLFYTWDESKIYNEKYSLTNFKLFANASSNDATLADPYFVPRIDTTQSIFCTVRMNLNQNVLPFNFKYTLDVMYNSSPTFSEILRNFRTQTQIHFPPRSFGFEPLLIEPLDDCTTQQNKEDFQCTLHIRLTGNVDYPLISFVKLISTAIRPHQLFLPLTYKLYTKRFSLIETKTLPASQLDPYVCAVLDTTQHFNGKRIFDARVDQKYQQTKISCYLTLGTSELYINMITQIYKYKYFHITPSYHIPVYQNINDYALIEQLDEMYGLDGIHQAQIEPPKNMSAFVLPPMMIGELVSLYANQTTYVPSNVFNTYAGATTQTVDSRRSSANHAILIYDFKNVTITDMTIHSQLYPSPTIITTASTKDVEMRQRTHIRTKTTEIFETDFFPCIQLSQKDSFDIYNNDESYITLEEYHEFIVRVNNEIVDSQRYHSSSDLIDLLTSTYTSMTGPTSGREFRIVGWFSTSYYLPLAETLTLFNVTQNVDTFNLMCFYYIPVSLVYPTQRYDVSHIASAFIPSSETQQGVAESFTFSWNNFNYPSLSSVARITKDVLTNVQYVDNSGVLASYSITLLLTLLFSLLI